MNLLRTENARKPDRYAELFEHSLFARRVLEIAWSEKTAYQGIEVLPSDESSRGQCGVSSVWLAQYLEDKGFDAYYTEGIIHIPEDVVIIDEHVWVEVRDAADTPLVVDITSDQYKTIWGSKVHVGQYAVEGIIGRYTPKEYFKPRDVPRKKLMARHEILVENVNNIPKRTLSRMR